MSRAQVTVLAAATLLLVSINAHCYSTLEINEGLLTPEFKKKKPNTYSLKVDWYVYL